MRVGVAGPEAKAHELLELLGVGGLREIGPLPVVLRKERGVIRVDDQDPHWR